MERYTDTISGAELYVKNVGGSKMHYKDRAMTIRHRLDGPAFEWVSGYNAWWVDDKRHRLDVPAVEYADRGKEWYVDGVFIIETNPSGEIIQRMK